MKNLKSKKMLQASELRFGNLILGKTKRYRDGVVVAVAFSHIAGIVRKDDGITYEPIPLTEEWLIKLGFVILGSPLEAMNYAKKDNKFVLSCWDKPIGIEYDKGNGKVKLQYIHQLQNLYFALCGEKLKPSEANT